MSADRSELPPVASCRMGRRLLSGSGCAAVTAYRRDPERSEVVLHTLSADGQLLVATRPAEDGSLAMVPTGVPEPVRLDITLDAAEPGIRVAAASAHVLGTLRWLDEGERDVVLSACGAATCFCPITGDDPLTGLTELACLPGGRVGIVEFERVVVHDALGVTGLSAEEVLTPEVDGAPPLLWPLSEELRAHDMVRELGEVFLDVLCEGVSQGWVPGTLCSRQPSVGVCSSVWGRVICLDVSPHTLTLMRVTSQSVEVYLVVLVVAAATPGSFVARLRELVETVPVEGLVVP